MSCFSKACEIFRWIVDVDVSDGLVCFGCFSFDSSCLGVDASACSISTSFDFSFLVGFPGKKNVEN